jgi:hypothetical protein
MANYPQYIEKMKHKRFAPKWLLEHHFSEVVVSCYDKVITNDTIIRVVDYEYVFLVQRPLTFDGAEKRIHLANVNTKDKLIDLINLLKNK